MLFSFRYTSMADLDKTLQNLARIDNECGPIFGDIHNLIIDHYLNIAFNKGISCVVGQSDNPDLVFFSRVLCDFSAWREKQEIVCTNNDVTKTIAGFSTLGQLIDTIIGMI